jgi:hypothetical protein
MIEWQNIFNQKKTATTPKGLIMYRKNQSNI